MIGVVFVSADKDGGASLDYTNTYFKKCMIGVVFVSANRDGVASGDYIKSYLNDVVIGIVVCLFQPAWTLLETT